MSKKEIMKKITRYIRGKLNRQEADELWEEFLKNPEYYELFETELHLHELGNRQSCSRNDISESVKNHPAFFLRKEFLLPVAAFLIFCFGIIAYINSGKSIDAASLAFDHIEVKEILGAEVQRSENSTEGNLNVDINRGVAAAYQKNYEDAVLIFKNLVEQNIDPPVKSRIFYNLGILNYNQKLFKNASNYFEEVDLIQLESNNLAEKLLWFKAHTYLQIQDPVNSVRSLDSLIQMDGNFSSEAQDLKLKIQNIIPGSAN